MALGLNAVAQQPPVARQGRAPAGPWKGEGKNGAVAAGGLPAAEAGLENAIAYTFNMIFVPAGTPRAVIDKLSATMQRIMANKEFKQALIKFGVDPIADSNPKKAAAMLRTEIARYKPVIQRLALKQ